MEGLNTRIDWLLILKLLT